MTAPRKAPYLDQVFDPEVFWWALNYRRAELNLTWRKLLLQAGVGSPGLAINLTQGRSISVDNFFKLMRWLGETDITPYLRDQPIPNKAWDKFNRKDSL